MNKNLLTAIATFAACVSTTYAAVSAEEAKQLGGSQLTIFGAEKAGNKDGTIPPYTGIGVKPPSTWDPKFPGQRPDPYNDKPLFSITATNAAQYADKLDGMLEVFKKYPHFRMDIYPTHRDFVMPKYVQDNTLQNATACKAVERELKLVGCWGGIPFPIPKTGNQVMWNHLTSYVTFNLIGISEVWVVPPTGDPVLVDRGEILNNYPYYDPKQVGPLKDNVAYLRFIGVEEAPARLAGNKTMLIDAVDQVNIGRHAYVYATGRRWVKLAADLAYDTPNPYSGGTATMDDSRGFLGALDRFDFESLGKKEKFIYYDNYALTDRKACTSEKTHSSKNFPHPDCVRWELHRVWVVKATLKPGKRHIYTKRMFYWDEDTYSAGQGENYDAKGNLYRITTNHAYPVYEADAFMPASNTFMDLQTGLWASSGISNCAGCGYRFTGLDFPESMFDPSAMAGSGIR